MTRLRRMMVRMQTGIFAFGHGVLQ